MIIIKGSIELHVVDLIYNVFLINIKNLKMMIIEIILQNSIE